MEPKAVKLILDSTKPQQPAPVGQTPAAKYRLTVQKEVEAYCEECGETATWQLTFLLDNARRNPASAAYGRDDCAWCSDIIIFSCAECESKLRQNPPENHGWCAMFPKEKFPHLFLSWKKDEKLTDVWQDMLNATVNAAVTPAPAGVNPPRDADCYDEHMQGDVEVEDD